MGVRRACALLRRRWRALLLAGAALGALGGRVPARLASTHAFPAHSPAHLAHTLADFSNQPDIDSWSVEEDRSNYTTWRYSVSFSCGARCGGRASVLAHDEPAAAPRHGRAAREHRVAVLRLSCTWLPLVSWPQLCEELQIHSVVTGSEGGGAQLVEETRTRCGALAWLGGACARRLRALRDARLLRLRALPDLAPRVARA